MSGIFRPRQQVQRVTRNAGNRAFIAGGRGANRAVKPPGRVIPTDATDAPPPPPPPPEEGTL